LYFVLSDSRSTPSLHCEPDYAAHLSAQIASHVDRGERFIFVYDSSTGEMCHIPHIDDGYNCTVS